jgi:hypothetical protein
MPPYGRQCRLFILCRNAPAHFREAPIKCPISTGHRSGAKARPHFVLFTARLKRLRKNPERRANIPKNIPQGLKPILYYQHLAARLKSCPVTKLSPPGVFSRPKARRLLSCIYGTTEVVPFQKRAIPEFFAACKAVPFQNIDLFRGCLACIIHEYRNQKGGKARTLTTIAVLSLHLRSTACKTSRRPSGAPGAFSTLSQGCRPGLISFGPYGAGNG